ncbi:hypothetical protein [Micromonospora sp. DT229]|uniref:hypothetical protein n=1 Tax=Micromonospora sp. DT229 TaxID=3393430 RepID=UPI003CED3470
MNILSQIVPGLRDARTPFAVGLIWAITGWLAMSLLPRSVMDEPIIADAVAQIRMLPTEVAISVAAFLIYISGILLNAALRAVRVLVLAALGIGTASLIALAILALTRLLIVCVACGLMIVAVWALAALRT